MQLHARLFGKFQLLAISPCGLAKVVPLEPGKARELLCFVMLSGNRAHHREALSSLFWGEGSSERSLKYLRQALWQLQSLLGQYSDPEQPVLTVENDWVQLNSAANLWIDTGAFEASCSQVRNQSGSEFSPEQAKLVQEAAVLYTTDLLEGWHQDWCLTERERLQNLYLSTLDKLMDYCETHSDFENGLDYGARILAIDKARECTHQRLMRLHYLAGNRTAALRQYNRCSQALREELNVQPSKKTQRILELIQSDDPEHVQVTATRTPSPGGWSQLLGELEQLHVLMREIQGQIEMVRASGS